MLSLRRLLAVSFLLATAFALPALAAQATIALPENAKHVASVEGITEYRLDNGLRVLLFPDPSKQTVTVNITYLVGSRHEGYGESGMAHLLEHLLFKGTPSHPDIPQELTARGARPNGSTWYDRTNYFETFAATEENLDWALDLEADRMVNSFVAKKDLDSEMTVVRNEFEMGENDPRGILMERMQSAAYLWHNYGKSTIGSREDLERVPIERLQAFYRTWYRPDNAVLVVAGKFDEERTLAKIATRFGSIPRPSTPLPEDYTVEPPQDGERSVMLRRVGDTQTVAVLYHVPAGTHADYPAIDLLEFVLADTPSGRLHKALVETNKAAAVWGFTFPQHDPGSIMLGAELRLEHSTEEAKEILLKVVEAIASEPPTAQEVERARANRLKQWETTMRDSQRAAIELSEWSALGDWRLMFVNRDRLNTVSAADLTRAAGAYFRTENRTVGVYEPTKQAMRAAIPQGPDVASLVRDYKGGEALAQGEAFDPSPAAIEARTLRREVAPGIRLAMVPKKTRGSTVQLVLNLHFGDEKSLAGRATAAEMAGAMLMRGTTRLTREQIQDEIDRLRAQIRVGGSADGASASIDTTREHLAEAVTLVAEILRQPSFPESEFEILKRETLAALEESKSDPGQMAGTALEKHLNPWSEDDPRYVMSPEESIAATQAASLADVRRFHQEFYGASHAELGAVGDFDPAELEALIAKAFAGFKSGKPYARLANTYRSRPPLRQRLEAPDKESAYFLAGLRIDMRDDAAEYPAMMLGNFMTGGGFLNSRLAERLRQKDGLSYGAGSWFSASPFDRDASFGSYAIYAPQNADRLLQAFDEEIARVIKDGFTDQEIAEAKTGWLQSRQVSRSNDRELARTLASREYQRRTLTWDAGVEEKVSALTNAGILAAMRKAIDPSQISVVQAGDFAKAKTVGANGGPGAAPAP